MTSIFQCNNNFFSCLKSIHPNIQLCIYTHGPIFIENIKNIQTVFYSNLVIVHVMSRCDLQCARPKVSSHIIISNNGNFSIYQWDNCMATHKVFISFVRWIYGNGCITKNSFRSYCGNGDTFMFKGDQRSI